MLSTLLARSTDIHYSSETAPIQIVQPFLTITPTWYLPTQRAIQLCHVPNVCNEISDCHGSSRDASRAQQASYQ